MKRRLATILLVGLSALNGLSVLDWIDLGVLIWPIALGTIVAAVFLITTPSERDLGHG